MKKISWFIAYTFSRSEKKVEMLIKKMGIEVFLPLHKVKRKWSDRMKIVEVPLFASYVFVHTTERNISRLLGLHGIARFLTFENKLATISDQEIELIKKVIKEGQDILVEPRPFRKGQRVQVEYGPFAGLEGVLITEQGKNRFILEIEGLTQVISVNIPDRYLVPVTSR